MLYFPIVFVHHQDHSPITRLGQFKESFVSEMQGVKQMKRRVLGLVIAAGLIILIAGFGYAAYFARSTNPYAINTNTGGAAAYVGIY